MTCTHCGSIAAPSNGVCPSCGRPVSSATPDVWPDPLAASAPLSPTAVLGENRSEPDHPPTKAMPTSPYGVPVDPFTGPTTGDPYAPPHVGPTEPFTAPPVTPTQPFAAPPPATQPFSAPPVAPTQPFSSPVSGAPDAGRPSSAPPADAYAPPAQPYPGQPYPPQAYPGQPYPPQAYPGQPYPGQQYPPQPYPGQPYPGQPYPGQPYPGHGSYPESQSNVFSILAFVFGGIGVLLVPIVFAGIGLILGYTARRRGERLGGLAVRVASFCLLGGILLGVFSRATFYRF